MRKYRVIVNGLDYEIEASSKIPAIRKAILSYYHAGEYPEADREKVGKFRRRDKIGKDMRIYIERIT